MKKVHIRSLKKNPEIKTVPLKLLALLVLELEKASEDAEIDITIVDNIYIQKLNKKYKKIDSPTDVLSFPIEIETLPSERPKREVDVGTGLKTIPTKFLGDIYVSLDKAKEQISPGETLELEVSRLLIHGILHLLNYKHGKKMEEKQENYLKKYQILKSK